VFHPQHRLRAADRNASQNNDARGGRQKKKKKKMLSTEKEKEKEKKEKRSK